MNNILYLIELDSSESLEYNNKTLCLTDDFLQSHSVIKLPITHRDKGAYWSESLGVRKGFCHRLRFKLASEDFDYINDVARYLATRMYIAILPTEEGMRVFYSPHRRCKTELNGADPLRHTCSLWAGPTCHPFYYADRTKSELDNIAKDFDV